MATASTQVIQQRINLSDDSVFFIEGTDTSASARFELGNTGDIVLTLPSATGTLATTGGFITNPLSADLQTTNSFGITNSSSGVLALSTATAGDITLTSVDSVTVSGAEAAADAIRLNASDAAGGIDIDAGTGGFDVLTTGAFSIDGTGASNVSADSGTLTLATTTSGNVIISPATDNAAVIFDKQFYSLNTTTTTANLTYTFTFSTAAVAYVDVVATKRDTTDSTNPAYFRSRYVCTHDGTNVNGLFEPITESSGTANGTNVVVSCADGAGDAFTVVITKHTSDTSTTWSGFVEVTTDDTSMSLAVS